MNKDRHPELGPRQRCTSMEACLDTVRRTHPTASAEGSMGAERSFWVNSQLVAHAWPVARHPNDFWLRGPLSVSDILSFP